MRRHARGCVVTRRADVLEVAEALESGELGALEAAAKLREWAKCIGPSKDEFREAQVRAIWAEGDKLRAPDATGGG